MHQIDGKPSIEWGNGSVSYYLDDKHYTKDDYFKELKKRNQILKIKE